MSGEPPARDPELAGAGEAWLEASDGLLAGVGHALNNRVAALAAVGQVIASTTEGPLGAALSAESVRLQQAVHLLRLLVRRWSVEPEPVQLAEVLADVAELLSHHPDLREATLRVETEGSLPPLLAERSSLTHAFCILLIPAARAAERAGAGTLRVRCSATPVSVVVEVPFAAAPAAGNDEPPAAAEDPRAARGLIERAGGELSVREEGDAAASLRVSLPTLQEARRRERGEPAPPPAGGG